MENKESILPGHGLLIYTGQFSFSVVSEPQYWHYTITNKNMNIKLLLYTDHITQHLVVIKIQFMCMMRKTAVQ